jgi:predicted ABC-class ATPase
MLLTELPTVVERALIYTNLDQQSLEVHVECGEDATALREQLQENNLVAFVAAGAILPRRSGVSDLPRHENVIPFAPPPSLTIALNRPNAGPIKGMGIPAGVSLIVGGGYHGKSTLLSALAQGVYNHVPGDGRECVVTADAAVLIRSEDGRFVAKTDLSPFIRGLPDGTDTRCFISDNASGSTSQAANIAEALEVRASLLLVDEDTSATNFMIRDQRMQELVVKAKEPITPFIDRVHQLYEEHGVSTILVMGGSGDYFEVADTVIMMDAYRPHEVTAKAKEIANRLGQTRTRDEATRIGTIRPRRPDLGSIHPRTRKGRIKVRTSNNSLRLGRSTIDLSRIHQIAEPGQVRAIAYLLVYLAEHRQELPTDGTIAELSSFLERRMEQEDMWWFLPFRYGDIAAPRRFELGAALNRLRTLRIIE